MDPSYPALTQLASAYFHQDFDAEYDDDAEAALADFVDNDRSTARGLPAEVQRALAEHPDDEALEMFWTEVLGADWFTSVSGLSPRGWFEHIAARAGAARGDT